MANSREKMVLAILQGDDYEATIVALNKEGFFATVLSSTGGFLRKRSVTLLIGVEEERLKNVLDILRARAGKRAETVYQDFVSGHGNALASAPVTAMTKMQGGATVFVLDVEQFDKF